jgi:uncharacterized protein
MSDHPHTATSTATRAPNRLAREKSPYLLQHAHNPVDWYPWGDEAFEKARREDKPVFLSIGYSTCHWCHVMERESFEDPRVAELLNRWFVPVKVDREERPDVDRLYMTAMQAMGMGGGWPLNAFLTPSLEPFFGGTYFPPDSRHGRPGMIDVLPRVHEAWSGQREQIAAHGARVFGAIAAAVAERGRDAAPADPETLFARAAEAFAHAWDREHGGFGGAPKFPSPANLAFLLRVGSRLDRGGDAAVAMAFHQLDAMRGAGIHDHLGGGFHRYATDERWMVPHFEKMLYDQALLAGAYLDACALARAAGPRHDPLLAAAYAEAARGVFAYVARDLTAPEGAFWSAEDADSEGEEGKFYVWTPAEVDAALGTDDGALARAVFGVTDGGNFEGGTSILHAALGADEALRRFGGTPQELGERVAAVRDRLRAARERRPRPHLDDKVLAAWNGLMIGAFARGARVLGDPELAQRAARAASFVWERMRDAEGGIVRRWRDGEARGHGQLDDHAHYARGLVELFGATHDPVWLERALAVVERALEYFWDDADGGAFESRAGDPHVRVRMKDDYDGAELAGNSTLAETLHVLASLLDREDWRARHVRLVERFAARLAGHPTAMPQMLVALDRATGPARHVVIAGDPARDDTRALLAELDRRFRPRDVDLVIATDAARARLARLAPFLGTLVPIDGRATAYVCEDRACRLPVTDPAALVAQLEGPVTA